MTIPLTPAEERVVGLIARDMLTYPEAARALGWSKHTVRNYIRRIALKLPGDGSSQRKVIAYYAPQRAA